MIMIIKVRVIPTVTGVLSSCVVCSGLLKERGDIEIRGRVETILTT